MRPKILPRPLTPTLQHLKTLSPQKPNPPAPYSMPSLISIGQLVDQSWEHFRAKLRELLEVSAWLFIPCILSIISAALYPNITSTEISLNWWQTIGVIIGDLNSFLVAPVIGLWVFIVLVKLLAAQRDKKTENLSAQAKAGWKLFFPCVLINLQVAGVFALSWLAVGPGLIINWLGFRINIFSLSLIGAFLAVIGIVLAGILTIRWLVDFTFAPYLLITAGDHGKKALWKSRALVLGRFWPVLFRILIPKIIFVGILVLVDGALGVILDRIIYGLAGLNIDLITKLETIGLYLMVSLGSVFFTPLLIAADYLLFESLRETKK